MKKTHHCIIIFIFLGLLILPHIADKLCGVHYSTAGENRNLASFPQKIGYKKLASALEEYYNDRIPFRSVLIGICRKVQNRLFVFSSGKILMGEEGFFFYRKPGWEDQVDQYRGREKLRHYDLEKNRKFLNKLSDHLKNKKIAFLMVIAPNKVEVYPEHLPERRKYYASNMSPNLQLVSYMQKHNPEIAILHLQQELLEAKKYFGNKLFYRIDSHWSPIGGYIGARKIIKHLDPQAVLPPAEELKIIPSGRLEPYDLQYLSLRNINVVKPQEQKLSAPEYTGKIEKTDNMLYTNNPEAPVKQRVLMYRDSFTDALIPYISHHFQEVYYVRSHRVSRKTIDDIQPDILILEYVARVIGRMSSKLY